MKKCVESIKVEESVYKRVLKCEDEVVLTITIRTPKLSEDTAAQRRIAKYYRRLGEEWKRRWEGKLYALACATLKETRDASRPFFPWEAQLVYTVTYNEKGLFSLYFDSYEYTGGAHGNTVRTGDTWDLCTGFPRALPTFFPPKSHWKRQVLAAVRAEIEARLATGESAFFDDWSESVAADFDQRNFYLTAEGVTVFYQLYTIAPYVEGIPTFLVVKWPDA